MTAEHRLAVLAPSEWDVVLSPELAPLFVLDAAILAAQRVLSILLDPSSARLGGADYPPTRALLDAMAILRRLIHDHRVTAESFDGDLGGDDNVTDHHIPDEEAEDGIF